MNFINEYLTEASKTMFQLSTDEQIRKRCRDREEYYQDIHNYELAIAQKDAELTQKDATIKEKDAENDFLRKQLEELKAQLNNSK